MNHQELMNHWQGRYFEALVELRRVNKGAQRLRRKLDNANRKLRRAGRPLEEREPPHCPTCDCGSRVLQPCTHDDPSWCDAECERWREWVKARRSSEPQSEPNSG